METKKQIEFTEESAEAMIEIIKTIVCRYYEVQPDRVYIKSRKSELIHCRHLIAYFVVKEIPNWLPLQWKSERVGYNGDHSMLIHIEKKFDGLLEWDKKLKKEVRDIKALITAAMYNENSDMLDEIAFMNFNTFVALRKNSNEAICMIGIDQERQSKIMELLGPEYKVVEMENTGYLLHKK